MSKFVGTYTENIRSFEPDNPSARNPWDANVHPEQYAYIQAIINRVDTEEVRPPKYTEETRQEVFRLRDAKFTLREIAEKVGVSKSTACLYLQNRYKTAQTAQTTQISCNEVDIGKVPVSKDGKDK